jgi:hypothetical protein
MKPMKRNSFRSSFGDARSSFADTRSSFSESSSRRWDERSRVNRGSSSDEPIDVQDAANTTAGRTSTGSSMRPKSRSLSEAFHGFQVLRRKGSSASSASSATDAVASGLSLEPAWLQRECDSFG